MTLSDRALAYNTAYAKFPASHLRVVQEQGKDVLYGTWMIGQDYRNKSKFYGAYPRGYLERIHAIFPDLESRKDTVLHVFSGSLPAGPYTRCDVVQDCDLRADVTQLLTPHQWTLVLADPPYSSADAEKYGTSMVNRGAVTRSLAKATKARGFLVWLDVTWPMHRKDQWRTVGRIALVRSTNHRVRMISIFQRAA